ncbi:MAG: response regulator [Chitinophagaceae bacterium]
MQPTTKHVVLYADDDSDDQQLIKQAFQQYDSNILVQSASNGEEALIHLKNLDLQHHRPCLIILDINMPKMNGKEALVKIRQSEKFNSLPVVLFSTSSSGLDKEFAKKWKANFISKPLTYADLATIAEVFVKHCDTEVSKNFALQ